MLASLLVIISIVNQSIQTNINWKQVREKVRKTWSKNVLRALPAWGKESRAWLSDGEVVGSCLWYAASPLSEIIPQSRQ